MSGLDALDNVDPSTVVGLVEAREAIAKRRVENEELARELGVASVVRGLYFNYELVLAQYLLREAMNLNLSIKR